jgi:transposase-like protein
VYNRRDTTTEVLIMARRKRGTPEQQARRALISELLSAANVQSMDDIHELFKETIAEFMEGGLEAELDDELGYEPYDVKNKETDNSRNGHSKKSLRTSMGKVEIDVPRDRNGDFEPRILRKNQTSISQDMENKIISMYAKGMSTSDIEEHIRDIYGLEISDTTVSRITDKVRRQKNGSRDRLRASMRWYSLMLSTIMSEVRDRLSRRLYI